MTLCVTLTVVFVSYEGVAEVRLVAAGWARSWPTRRSWSARSQLWESRCAEGEMY